MYYFDFVCAIGKVWLTGDEQGLISLDLAENPPFAIGNLIKNERYFLVIYNQLTEYFAGKRQKFDVSLQLKGTEFQRKVWRKLCEIPYGQTITYKELATNIGNPKAHRAAANANAANKLPIIIPCHRVIASNGKLGGYSLGTDLKQYLLNLEHSNLSFKNW